MNASAPPFDVPDWEDCTSSFQVGFSLARGGGIWPSMVNIDASELSGSITADDCRALAELLIRAAVACDASTEEVLGVGCARPGHGFQATLGRAPGFRFGAQHAMDEAGYARAAADAEFIAEVRNALPLLLDVAEAAQLVARAWDGMNDGELPTEEAALRAALARLREAERAS